MTTLPKAKRSSKDNRSNNFVEPVYEKLLKKSGIRRKDISVFEDRRELNKRRPEYNPGRFGVGR